MPILTKQFADNNVMPQTTKTFFLLFSMLTLVAMLLLPNAKAQTVEHQVIEEVALNQAELDQILAPIALYPDSLLSQILVASTYPLEVVQATRWRQENPNLDESQVLSAVENKDWDPSVKALAPFEDLLVRISEDLQWLQNVGDAFLQNEDQVLASVQNLRQRAYDNGSITDNEYYEVVEDDNNIVIESTTREIVYVPYYDTRVVYGNWWWDGYRPTYWDRPRNYVHLSGGFYWNSRFFIRPNIFFGGFHWGSRRLVVNHYYYDDPYRYRGYGHNSYNTYYNINISNYRHWSHNPVHRRGVRYPDRVVKSFAGSNNRNATAGYGSTAVRKTQSTINKPTSNNRQVTNTTRSSVSQPTLRERSVSKVQEKLSNTKQATRSVGVVDRRSSTTTTRPTTNTTRPTTNRTIVNKTTTTVNRAATPTRSTPVVRNTQRSTPTVRQRAVTQKTNSTVKSSNRTSSKASTSAAKVFSKTTSNTSSTSDTSSSTTNRGKWSR